jgi:single-stranded-DNA-specific exonuclease
LFVVGLTTPELVQARFGDAFAGFALDRACALVGHNDADGLSAMAILARALERASRPVQLRIVGRGESARSAVPELDRQAPGGIICCDLGVVPHDRAPAAPVICIDHHVPRGCGVGLVISGMDFEPPPPTSLLAYWCARAIANVDDLLWLAAIGLIGDMAEAAGVREMDEARRRFGTTKLRRATALINAARRRGSGDASPALSLLMLASGPDEVLNGQRPETAELQRAKAEVAAALEEARRVAPKIRNGVALIRADSPCQIHPLLAQQWRGRLKNEIVLAANAAFRPGWVHFAVRSSRDVDLINFLAHHVPPGADGNYGSGHRAATGGALPNASWNRFILELGFDAADEVQA